MSNLTLGLFRRCVLWVMDPITKEWSKPETHVHIPCVPTSFDRRYACSDDYKTVWITNEAGEYVQSIHYVKTWSSWYQESGYTHDSRDINAEMQATYRIHPGVRDLYQWRPLPVADWQGYVREWIGDYKTKVPAGFPHKPEHMPFVHFDEEQEAYVIGFFASEQHGQLFRATAMKPGRYLARFFPEIGMDEQRMWASKIDAFGELHIATTTEDIVSVYVNGPNSCMSKPLSAYDGHIHPVSVYGDSDLALAYLGSKESATARCLIWPGRKVFGRIYGDEIRMRMALEREGYSDGRFRGARIRAIVNSHNSGEVIMPYLDGDQMVSRVTDKDGDWFVIDCDGPYCCDSTRGTIHASENSYYCPYLDEYCDEDDTIFVHGPDEHWHNSCVENGDAFECDGSGNTYSTRYHSQIETEDGRTYESEWFFENGGYECELTGEHFMPNPRRPRYAPVVSIDTEETAALCNAEAEWFRSPAGEWFTSEESYRAHYGMDDTDCDAVDAVAA